MIFCFIIKFAYEDAIIKNELLIGSDGKHRYSYNKTQEETKEDSKIKSILWFII